VLQPVLRKHIMSLGSVQVVLIIVELVAMELYALYVKQAGILSILSVLINVRLDFIS